MVWLTPILYILLKVLSIFVETLDCVKYFVWVVFSLLIPPFIWNREICNLTWTWFWAKTLRLENTISPPGLGREIVLYKTPLFIGRFIHQGCTPRPGLGKNGCPDLPRLGKFSRLARPTQPAPKILRNVPGQVPGKCSNFTKTFWELKKFKQCIFRCASTLQTMFKINTVID